MHIRTHTHTHTHERDTIPFGMYHIMIYGLCVAMVALLMNGSVDLVCTVCIRIGCHILLMTTHWHRLEWYVVNEYC